MEFSQQDEYFMQRALQLANQAAMHNEVPVGAVVVFEDKIIGEGWNKPIGEQDCTCHAEIVALRAACDYMQNYRLPKTTLYVTLEPCLMCAGAIIYARLKRLVFGAYDLKSGVAGSVTDVFKIPQLNHIVLCEQGLLAKESSMLLKIFFKAKR